MNPEILYDDNHLLVVNKPSGLVTQPTRNSKESLEEWAKAWVKKKAQKSGNVFLHAIHRLDRKASGLVVFARTSKALSRLNHSLREGKFQKTYIAVVEGVLSQKEGSLRHYVVHDDFNARVVSSEEQGGKLALLNYTVLKISPRCTLVSIDLKTGRYHQIRVQFSAIGSPVLGDQTYGCAVSHENTIALCHSKVTFPHPVLGNAVTFEAPLPYHWSCLDRSGLFECQDFFFAEH